MRLSSATGLAPPVIDVAPLVSNHEASRAVATQIHRACRKHGFFYVRGHGVDETLVGRLATLSRQFFAQDREVKMTIRMERGGRAWRGYFPVGKELTAGQPDQKEGLYFGTERGPDDPPRASGSSAARCQLVSCSSV